MRKYQSLIEQTFDFPTNEFWVEKDHLYFNGIPLMALIEEHGTPLKISYLPKITEKIRYARKIFRKAMHKYKYQGEYTYCYCTKSSHFRFIIEHVLKNECQLETSSQYDLEIIKSLYQDGAINKDLLIISNGFKMEPYLNRIVELINIGFENLIPIIDNINEVEYYKAHIQKPYKVGIRVAAEEEPNFDFYTSRLGIRYRDIVDFYNQRIKDDPYMQLKTVHFFINSGIRDSAYYWSELSKFVHKYCELKKICPELDTIDIGGGFPIRTSLDSNFEYDYMAEQIIENIQAMCRQNDVPEPHIITEFGNYTVGESGAMIYSIVDQKMQNDREIWYMIDGSFITHMPDTWAKKQKFILMAINNWDRMYQEVHLGGITCDSDDFYNSEANNLNIFMPTLSDQKQYIGFFHTGAYQDSIGGYGGIQHCLIPAPKHLVIDRNEWGELKTYVFRPEQDSASMLSILGYNLPADSLFHPKPANGIRQKM